MFVGLFIRLCLVQHLKKIRCSILFGQDFLLSYDYPSRLKVRLSIYIVWLGICILSGYGFLLLFFAQLFSGYVKVE